MTLLLFFLFLPYALVQGSAPSNISPEPLPIIGDDEFSLTQQNKISAELSPTAEPLPPEAPTPEVYLATQINPTQTDCRTDCVVGLPAATVYKWQQVTITSTITVETVTHVVNPEYFPNATGTMRSYGYPVNRDEVQRDRYSLDKVDGVAVTTLDLGYKKLPVTFPTPVTVTPTTLTLVGGPPATASQESPACTPAVVQSVNLTTPENAKLFAFGDVEASNDRLVTSNWTLPSQPNKSVKDTVHWRLMPEHFQQVDVVQFRGQFPYIMALDVCGAFGPPDQPASVTQLSGNAWATTTVTSTVSGSRDPRINPLINLTRKQGTSLDGPGARPTEGPMHVETAHQEVSAQPMTQPVQKSGIALPMMTEVPGPEPSGQLVGPAPRPVTTQQWVESASPVGSLIKPSPKPAIGGETTVGAKKAAPMVVNGHTFTPKGRGTWETDDGQILRVGGPQIELDNSSHGKGHKMKVGLDSGTDGHNVLVVDGASMTLDGDDFMPAATGSSRAGGRGGRGGLLGSSSGSSGSSGISSDMDIDTDSELESDIDIDTSSDTGSVMGSDLSSGSRSGLKAPGGQPAMYTGSAHKISLSWTLSIAAGSLGVVVFL